MSTIAPEFTTDQTEASHVLADRTTELYRERRYDNFCRTDRMFCWLLIAQWIAGIVLAIWISPKTWIGPEYSPHIHVYAAIFVGGVIASVPLYVVYVAQGSVIARHVIAVAQAFQSALLIHLSGGRIETHFHIFGSLAFLAFYRDYRVLGSATEVIALDHMIRGLYFPQSVFGVLVAESWRWVEHAGWVIFEDIFLIRSCYLSSQEEKAIAFRQAQTEQALVLETNIIQNIPNGLLVIDPHEKVTHYNQALVTLLGLGNKNYVGTKSSEVLGSRVAKLVEQVSLTSESSEQQIEMKAPGNREIQLHVQPIKGLDKDSTSMQYGKVIVAHDVTEINSMNEMKSTFVSTVSHELRTPLTSIMGFAKLNQKKLEKAVCASTDTEAAFALASMRQVLNNTDITVMECTRLMRLINDVLDVVKLESETDDKKRKAEDVTEIVQHVLDVASPLVDSEQVKFKIDSDPNIPKVECDRDQIIQVITNYVSNATKFTEKGSITCELRADNDQLVVSVRDTGIGISGPDQKKVFAKFHQCGEVLTDKPQGTGLGLAICKEIVENHAGRVWVESEVGTGTTFAFSIPLKASK